MTSSRTTSCVRRANRRIQRSRPSRANAPDLPPLSRLGRDDGREAAEMLEQRPCRDGGDPRNCRKRCFSSRRSRRRLRPLGVRWPVPRGPRLTTLRKIVQPACRVIGLGRSDQPYAEIQDRQARSSNRLRRQRPIVEIFSFDEQVRNPRAAPEATKLAPEGALGDGSVQAPHRLPLDDATAADVVVADAQTLDLHRQAPLAKKCWHTAAAFVDVCEHAHSARNVARSRPSSCAKTASNRSQLALSRSESA